MSGNDPKRSFAGAAWVCFIYGDYWTHPWQDLAEFVLGFLGPGLAQESGDRAAVSIAVKESGRIQDALMVRPDGLQRTIRAIRRLSLCSCDKLRT